MAFEASQNSETHRMQTIRGLGQKVLWHDLHFPAKVRDIYRGFNWLG
jgi:hypothetical protein